ncbi:hypothetical protein ACFO0M_26745 [Micromonospora mangrovi]|uniref:Uncharacterized protein n=2 Tax=Micromonospora TaxID=1873 RepID=A0AAU7MDJ6_9ACTN
MARARKRSIHVDGVDYRWTVRRIDAGHVSCRVWPVPPGAGCRFEVRLAFDDPWLNFGPIITTPADRVAEAFALTPVTPQLVAELIQAVLAAGAQADEGGPLRCTLTDSGPRLEPASGRPAG